jgi:hypothetical protein
MCHVLEGVCCLLDIAAVPVSWASRSTTQCAGPARWDRCRSYSLGSPIRGTVGNRTLRLPPPGHRDICRSPHRHYDDGSARKVPVEIIAKCPIRRLVERLRACPRLAGADLLCGRLPLMIHRIHAGRGFRLDRADGSRSNHQKDRCNHAQSAEAGRTSLWAPKSRLRCSA